MVQPKLTVLENKLWITFTSLDRYREQKSRHCVYICPIVKNGIACNIGGRSDKLRGKQHHCNFYNQDTIEAYFQPRKDTASSSEETLSVETDPVNTSPSEDDQFQKIVIAMAQCNISFKAICSQAFRNLIRCLSPEDSASHSLDTFVSRLNYHTLTDMLIRIGKERKQYALTKLANKTVTVMFDKGRIAKNDCTAVTILVHDSVDRPLFWDLGYACHSVEDYTQLANSYVNELDQYNIHVFAFCTDGLPVQRRALTSVCLQESKAVPFMHPIWIYCTNHLANLVVQDSVKANSFLSAASSCLKEFVTVAHSSKSIKVLHSICPGFAITRWLALGNISSYIIKHKVPILKENILSKEKYLMILQLDILLSPLIHLQLALESAGTRLSDVFLLLQKTIHDFLFIRNHAAFSGPPLEALRCIITSFYKRFLYRDQGDLYALAYLYTPAGLSDFLRHHFTWKMVYDSSLRYDSPELSKGVYHKTDGLFSFSSLRDSFAIVQRTVRAVNTTKDILLEIEDFTSKRRATLTAHIEEARKLQEECNLQQSPSSSTTTISASEVPPRDDSQELQDEEESLGSEQLRGVINSDYLDLMDADLDEEKDGEYTVAASEQAQMSSSSSSSSSNQYQLRPGKTVIIIRDDEDDDVSPVNTPENTGASSSQSTCEPTPSSDSHEESSSLMSPPEQSYATHFASVEEHCFTIPTYTTDAEEYNLIGSLICCATDYWYVRMCPAFISLVGKIMPTLDVESAKLLQTEFEQFITPSSNRRIMKDAFAFHYHLGTVSHPSKLFNFQAWCLLSAGCSEASCERIFSLAKWIVGDRRCRLKLETIAHLLHVLCN